MTCHEARNRLGASSATPPGRGPLADHLTGCAACTAYAARLALARRAFAEHHAGVEPPAGFAARVAQALPARGDLLGWAALRLLPAALALVLVLAGWALVRAHSTPVATGSQTAGDDLLAWVLQGPEEAP
jgi:hypothetical protein